MALQKNRATLNPSQRQRLMVSCKHIDRLLGDIEATLNIAASHSVFPNYANDIGSDERQAIERHVAKLRSQLVGILADQSLAPEAPQISASHSIYVGLTFIEIAIAELAPEHMRGYGPVSPEGAQDLNAVIAELQSAVRDLFAVLDTYSKKPSRMEETGP